MSGSLKDLSATSAEKSLFRIGVELFSLGIIFSLLVIYIMEDYTKKEYKSSVAQYIFYVI